LGLKAKRFARVGIYAKRVEQPQINRATFLDEFGLKTGFLRKLCSKFIQRQESECGLKMNNALVAKPRALYRVFT
jgi:hypothetical protein